MQEELDPFPVQGINIFMCFDALDENICTALWVIQNFVTPKKY